MPLDAGAVDRARAARARMDKAQREAFEARAELQDAVADLHRSGASLRDIGEALALSHQRIHQLLDQRPSVWARLTRQARPRRRALSHCSFCGRPQTAVEKVIAGPGVYICNECVLTARPVPLPAAERCSFCGRHGSSMSTAGHGVRICDGCLELCREVLVEDGLPGSR